MKLRKRGGVLRHILSSGIYTYRQTDTERESRRRQYMSTFTAQTVGSLREKKYIYIKIETMTTMMMMKISPQKHVRLDFC